MKHSYRKLMLMHAPALAHLLDILDAGITPDWLEVLAAISQGVDYLTDQDRQACSTSAQCEMPPDSYCTTC